MIPDWLWTSPIFWSASAAALVALTGGGLTELGPWYYKLQQPSWKPPDWLFGPAWTLIFALCAVAAAEGWEGAPNAAFRWGMVALFALNGVLNMAWSLLFFRIKRPDWALIEIAPFWLSIVALIVLLAQIGLRPPLLLAPYLIWVSFAAYLNLAIVRLNPRTETANG